MAGNKEVVRQKLSQIEGIEFYQNFDLKNYSTMKLPSNADLIVIKNIEALKKTLPLLRENHCEYKLLGWGANQIIQDRPDFIYLKLELPFDKSYLGEQRERYILPASVSLAVLTSCASKFNLSGWEFFTGVPATLGGAVTMNAGTNLGEIGSLVRRVKVVDIHGKEKNYEMNEKSFSYRTNNFLRPGEVIVEVEMIHLGVDQKVSTIIKDYLKLRNKTQPLSEKTCGCMFKNFIGDKGRKACRAGKSIDIIGLKGFSFNGAMISHKHANFMVNTGSAEYEHVKQCLKIVQDELYLQYGIKFDVEFEL